MTKILKGAIAAFALVTAWVGYSNGNVYEILRCDQDGNTLAATESATSPLDAGTTAYFKLRLVQNGPDGTTATAWRMGWIGTGSKLVDDALSPAQIQIYVSGKATVATYTGKESVGIGTPPLLSEFIFSYTVQPGDFGLPIVLATADGPADSSSSSSAYVMDPVRALKWAFVNTAETDAFGRTLPGTYDDCNLYFWTETDTFTEDMISSETRTVDPTTVNLGLYARTLDFDDDWERAKGTDGDTDAGLWRSVHAGSDSVVGLTPKIVSNAGTLTKATTLYVWSDNENAVYPYGDNVTNVDMTVGYKNNAPVTQKVKVGIVTVKGGKDNAEFGLFGGTKGETGNLILSAYPGYRWTAAGHSQVADYVTVPVECAEELECQVNIKAETTTVKASGDYTATVGQLVISLSKTYDEDVTFTVTPAFSLTPVAVVPGESVPTWGDYVRIAADETTISALPAAEPLTVTIKKGAKLPTSKYYLYALRSDKNVDTIANHLTFAASTTNPVAAAAIKKLDGTAQGSLIIDAENPVVTSMFDGANKTTAVIDSDCALKIAVSDVYADSTITNAVDGAVTNGYTIAVNYDTDSSADFETLPGVYTVGRGGLLYLAGSNDTTYPTIQFSVQGSPVHAAVRITSPITQLVSDDFAFDATVSVPAGFTVATSDGVTEVNEGDTVSLVITLDTQNTYADLYAYLKPTSESARNAVDCAWLAGYEYIENDDDTITTNAYSGVRLQKYDSVLSGSAVGLTMIDGDGTKLGSTYTYDVVFSTSPTWDGTVVNVYREKNPLRITTHNVVPSVTSVTMNGNRSQTVTADGATMKGSFPINISQTFKVKVNEPGTYDKTITEENKQFQVRWWFEDDMGNSEGPIEAQDSGIIKGDPDTTSCTYAFPAAGTYTVTVELLDKDMGTDNWGNGTIGGYFTFYVNAVDKPTITAEPVYTVLSDRYEETETEASFNVKAEINNCTQPLYAQMTVTTPNDELFEVSTRAYNTKTGGIASHLNEDGEIDYYLIELPPKVATIPVQIKRMDGSTLTSTTGIAVDFDVVLPENDFEVPNSGKQVASNYYVNATGTLRVKNIDPTIEFISPEPTGTNEIVTAIGDAPEPITWNINDVYGDFTNKIQDAASMGIRVRFSGGAGNGGFDHYYSSVEEANKAGATGFTPNFTASGSQTVTMYVTDKDGGKATWNGEALTWTYRVEASKQLITYATGPSEGIASSALSQKYVGLKKGIGSGRVYVSGVGLPTSSDAFSFTWNCQKQIVMSLYASGYKVGDVANGTLHDKHTNTCRDYKITAAGAYDASAEATDCYAYPGDYDSFLYTWILHSVGENGGMTSALMGSLSPEKSTAKGPSAALVSLPTEQTEDGNYTPTYAEAVFAKEWRVKDNCGDINQDGIPDLDVLEYGLGVVDATTREVTGSDVADVSAYNDDTDYLPGSTSAGNRLVPNIGSTWSSAGKAFNAYLELRGIGVGLNAYPNAAGEFEPDYTANEMRAYLLWKGVESLANLKTMSDADVETLFTDHYADAAADLKSGAWSPERPTDPSVEDTDNDGMPDGYEYWFWYAAKVGYSKNDDNGNPVWQGPMVGHQLNLAHIDSFDERSSADIMAAFDPLVNGSNDGNAATRGSIASRDFDNDGLSDLEEFAIGTSPVECDTDDDGLPDGWEVIWGLNPLDGDSTSANGANGNPDGDFMARATAQIICVNGDEDETASGAYYLANAADIEQAGVALEEPLTIEVRHMGGTEEEPIDLETFQNTYTRTIGGERIPSSRTLTRTEVTFAAGQVIHRAGTINLIHDQVYTFYGFDPRTAWSGGHAVSHAEVTARWCSLCNPSSTIAGQAGLATNTRSYSNKQEYLYGMYNGIVGSGGVLAKLKASCTNPNVIVEDKTYGDDTTTYSSARHGADTSGDGIPDGWEIYVGGDPIATSPTWGSLLSDDDQLGNAAEFAGTDSCSVYSGCETIAANTPTAGWTNKFFPTDPGAADTDGDGIDDYSEGGSWTAAFYAGRQMWPVAVYSFVYPSGETDDGLTLCLRGGGMNPCSVDTDYDGLPDGWEMQYAGPVVTSTGALYDKNNSSDMYTDALKVCDGLTVASTTDDTTASTSSETNATATGCYVMGGMDATDGADAYTSTTVPDTVTGKIRDRDFDRDGLENFQEYLVQAVRLWRYDDTETPLNGRAIVWTGDAETTKLTEKVDDAAAYLPMNILSGEEMLALVQASPLWDAGLKDSAYFNGSTREVVTTNYTDETETEIESIETTTNEVAGVTTYDYKTLGYMAPADHEWDPFYQAGLKADSTYGYCFMRIPSTMYAYVKGTGPLYLPASAYVTTDPRMWDTDDDGMDDYWEIFHGLNPLLGASDIINVAYATPIALEDEEGNETSVTLSAANDSNAWGGFGGLVYPELTADEYDPLLRPWRMGLANADPDGDGLRNIDEAIAGNLTSPTTYHTDPTPLWMTDTSSALSYVTQYYAMIQGAGDVGVDLTTYPWSWSHNEGIGSSEGANGSYRYAFEQTEGFDTDGDFRGDGKEVVKSVMSISDPLDATDPDRRTALYLSGTNSCAVSYMTGNVPVVDAYDVFRQFTVECWVKPEKTGAEQTILERGFVYAASNLENAEKVWRANFRIALNATGNVYGLFDNDNAVPSASDSASSQVITGSVLPTNEWSHVALTFDGKELAIYVNGQYKASAKTGLIPANGITGILQEPGDTNLYPMASYSTTAGMNTIGARCATTAFDLNEDFDQFQDFYQGYVDEVRFWDGARSAAEIAANYQTRMSAAEAAANRTAVYEKWLENATRNDNDGAETLPAQLMSLYNFQQLPAAVKAADVAQTASGFYHVLSNCTADATLVEVGWWTAMEKMHSTVYGDYHVVPWIQNTVSHLPLMDDSFADSMYWSEPYAGYTAASANGVSTYAIPNGGNPYASRLYKGETDYHYWRLIRTATVDETAAEYATKYAFQMRSEFVGLDDLIPLGGAYAKVDSAFWDGQGASTAWSDTGADTDGDGLPDWWEKLQGADLSPDTMIVYNGETMPAWQAYMRDLAKGMQPDGNVDATYVSTADGDNDGLADWWEDLYSVEGGANGDDDGDGLANYVEYLLSEVFKIDLFDPTDAFSVQDYASDYFFPVGESYVGEIFTDHDRVADTWEDKYSNAYATRYLYDAGADEDDDGWGNYAEFQFGTDPTQYGANSVDAEQMKEFPVPTIETILTYEGTQNTADKPFVVKAWRDTKLETIPDAVWTIGGSGTTTTSSNGNTNTVTGSKIVGMNPGKEVLYHLSPGSVVAGTVKFYVKDPNWFLYNASTGQRIVYGSDTALWNDVIADSQHADDATTGDLIYMSSLTVGSINYVTGAVTIDFAKLPTYLQIIGNIAASSTTSEDDLTGNYRSVYTLANSYVKISWNAQPITGGTSVHYYLADADKRTTDKNEVAHVKEGLNTFVAFCDLDGDGNYTAGEPYGVAPNVYVGWNYAKVNIELTDTTPVTARFSVGASTSGSSSSESSSTSEAANDRTTIWGTESGNLDPTCITIGKTTGGVLERVRVVRTAVNGTYVSYLGLPGRVVLDKVVSANNDPYITEADFLHDGSYDLDWETLADDLEDIGLDAEKISNVTYRVVLGDGPVSATETNNLLNIAFNRWFDAPAVFANDAKPVALGPGIVTAAAPTFKWTIPNGFNSYTAFRITVRDGSTTVWTSDFQPMPPRVRDADTESGWRYEWTAPLFADARTPDGKKVFTNNKNYTWSVTLANARYKNATSWSTPEAFRMNVLTNSADYGTMNVAVRYFGPAKVATSGSGTIRVQAFATPDFSGAPVGEGYVTTVKDIDNATDELTANATIIGLEAGTYYVRAFIDTVADDTCAAWESWGFACDRDTKNSALYTPKAITVGPKVGMSKTVSVFIDDSDTDQDNLPDAWEWNQKGDLTSLDVGSLDQTLTGSIAVKKSLTGALSGDGSLTTGLAVMLSSSLNSPYVAAMVMGVDISNATSASAAQKAVTAQVGTIEQTAEPKKVAFTAITLDPTTQTVTLKATTVVDAKTSGNVDAAVAAIYTFETTGDLTVTFRLWKKDALTDEAWTEVGSAKKAITVGEGTETVTLDLGQEVDLSNGFFKVTLEK